ncbi:PASTA domain-containing protein [Bifidobacterium sp. ESL0800]|uniref:PASTA domain-containing protein n=1 Tax=Bifidobacterium sp. ESL0800 TaxID=2983236 RepID=UPI0023F6F875|nr:PASTA domain-containing protein [Bifidobacterium sp. ESL0800]WEV75433.1 PASTA domain-containing protein [Bifidobacterium sp. ESL0800]
MKFCNQCGHRLDDDKKFCTHCGAPAPSASANSAVPSHGNAPQPSAAASLPPMPHNTPQPQSNAASGTGQTTAATAATAATSTITTAAGANSKKRLTILIAAIVAAALVIAGAGFGTYKAQLWGGKTVPSPADLGLQKASDTHEFSAADVEYSLHQRGFKTVTKHAFSGKPKGSFISYRHIDPSKRYSTHKDTITLVASGGPGVPGGTQGKPVQQVRKSLDSMKVPVHYHKVIVGGQGTKPDTVVASYPAPGQPVTDDKTGIEVGVATTGKGVGYDVVGMGKDQAQQQYAGAGFNVTLRARFSSKKMLGKIVDSYPRPGSEANGGNLILYYGIDASGFDEAVKGKNVMHDDLYGSQDDPVGAAAPVQGRYCTNGGECIDFTDISDHTSMPATVSSEYPLKDTNDYGHGLLFCGAIQQPFCYDMNETKKPLYKQGSGAFELAPYNYSTGFFCGSTFVEGDAGSSCHNGQIPEEYNQEYADHPTGATHQMGPLYIYFPVGSDVSKVMDSGYFDKAYVAKAKKQKTPDTSRPFFIRRDKSLYKKTSVSISKIDTPNPFLPTYGGAESSLEPVKPAPSDETAYYLVDQPQLDWDSLPDLDQ